jgi:hypothetical protein
MRPFRSANTRVICGAAALAVAAAGFGGACAAQPGGDGLTQPAAYHGPYLTWAGKTPAPGPARQPDVALAAPGSPSEFAAWPAPAPGAPRLRQTASAAYAAAPPRAYAAAAAPKPAASYASTRRTYLPAVAPKPAAVAAYVAPPAPAHHPRHTALSAPAAAAQAQAPAQVLAQNDTAAATAPAANPLAPTGVHYYSLHREYGLTPDQVATPKDRPMVLIGPPDSPPTQKQDDASDAGGSDKHSGAEGADE